MFLPEIDAFTTLFPDEIRALLAMVRMGNLGGLAVAECDDLDLRGRLFDYFRRRLETENIYLFNYEVSQKETNLVRTLVELSEHPRFKNLELTGKYRSTAIFVYGTEKFRYEQREHFVKLLNFLRDRLNTVPYPVVIWGSAAFVAQLARNAPDFWSWKGHSFKFPSVVVATQPKTDLLQDKAELYSNLSPMERYLRRILEDPDFRVWSELYLPLKAIRADETVAPVPQRHTLTLQELRQLAPIFPTAESYPAAESIYERGEKGEYAYIIVSGEVEVLIPDALGNEAVISRLGKGDFFGEISLLKNKRRLASVRTVKATKVLRLTKRSLSLLNHKASGVLNILTEVGQRRLDAWTRDSHENLSPLRRFALPDSNLMREKPVDVRELIAQDKCAIILGEAGAGKTTALRRIMLDTSEVAIRGLGSPRQEEIVVPIFIRLSDFTPTRSFEEIVLDIFHSYEIFEFETTVDVRRLFEGESPDGTAIGPLLFLMDGLNEVASQALTRARLNEFFNAYPRHRFLLSCRLEDYAAFPGCRAAVLQHLSGEDIEIFLVNYLRAEQGRKVAREIFSDPQLEELGQTPLALFMLAQIARRSDEELPKNRGLLFEVFTDNLLQRTDDDWQKILEPTSPIIPLALRKMALSALGIAMQEAEVWAFPNKEWVAILEEQIRNFFENSSPTQRSELDHISADELFGQIKRSGLVRYSDSRASVEFAHHTYQEFFAALYQRDNNYNLEPQLLTDEARRRWQGTIVLQYGIARDKSILYSKILGHENDYARIWLAAHCLANSGEEITAALQRLERTLPYNQHFALLFSAGLACQQLGRYPEALTFLHMANEELPGTPEVYYETGSLYRKVEQYERANEYLEEAIHLRSDFVDAYNQLGITYHDQGKYVEALTIFRATTQLEPGNAHHFYNLGTTQKVLRDYEGARKSFQNALALKPDYTEAKAQLSLLEKAMSTGVVRVLENIPILSKMTLEQSILLAKRIEVVDYRPGQIIFHMGEMGQTFYVIEAGEVEVLAPDMGGQPTGVINRLGPGDFFGEIALLRAIPRTATIRATKPTRLLAVSREDFEGVIQRYPSIAHSLAETSGLRLLRDRQIGRRVNLSRYYDPGYIAELTHQNEVTVVMGDIHGSTYLTNAIGPELMVAYLDEYLLRMSTIIVQAGGAMDKSLGDSVMGVFGNFPGRHEDNRASSANSALMAALKMRQAYKILRDEWKRESPEFSKTGMGIGISTGKVKTGTVGPEATMVGPAVNLSSKLSKLAIRGRTESEIYVDVRTQKLLGDSVATEPLDMAYTRRKVGVDLVAHRVVQRR
jgi:CRP-like cAMP-binding protein/tetratricopeptide (TPR) repeat protein